MTSDFEKTVKIINFKKTVKIVLSVIALILFLLTPILIEVVPYVIGVFREEAYYKKYFKETCEYVKENQEVYEEFSKYQISLYESENSNTIMEIEREGEHQEWRDIVFDHIFRARVHTNDNDVCVVYEIDTPEYYIHIVYQNDIYLNDGPERDTLVYITNDISVRMGSVRNGVV